MTLSCLRCKQKKLRCNRAVPCDRCVAADAVCATAERKPRVSHKSKDKVVLNTLNQRIEHLERALKGADQLPAASQHGGGGSTTSLTSPASLPLSTPSGQHEKVDVQDAHATEEWLGRELRAAKDFSINHLNHRGHLAENSPVSQAITELDGALTDLRGIGEVISNEDPSAIMTKEEAREAVTIALEFMRGEFFTSLIELDFMISINNIISSPHVKIDPAARLVYYNLVFHGFIMRENKATTAARTLYLQCLQAVPSWQETATGSWMDLVASSIMTWTTVISFDYNFAWKFHYQACRYAKQLGLHHLDVLASSGIKEDKLQSDKRIGFWQLVLVDLFFRLNYDKESGISAEASPDLVHVPDRVDMKSGQPRAGPTISQIVWGRVTLLTKTFFEHFDRVQGIEGGIGSSEFQEKVDELCDEVEDMINDWQVLTLMKAHSDKPLESWLYGDLIIGSYSVILQMDKLRHTGNENTSSERSLRLSRAILDTTVMFHDLARESKHHGAIYMYCIAFYPFRAFFSLYYHILNSDNPDLYKEDILRLERLGLVMTAAAQTRFEYIPLAKAVISLNRVTKHIQQMQTAQSPSRQWNGILPPPTPSSREDQFMNTTSSAAQQLPTSDGAGVANMPSDFQQIDFSQWLPDFGDMQFTATSDSEQAAGAPDFRPVEYMQALENQFMGRNWNYGWWDVSRGGPVG